MSLQIYMMINIAHSSGHSDNFKSHFPLSKSYVSNVELRIVKLVEKSDCEVWHGAISEL